MRPEVWTEDKSSKIAFALASVKNETTAIARSKRSAAASVLGVERADGLDRVGAKYVRTAARARGGRVSRRGERGEGTCETYLAR